MQQKKKQRSNRSLSSFCRKLLRYYLTYWLLQLIQTRYFIRYLSVQFHHFCDWQRVCIYFIAYNLLDNMVSYSFMSHLFNTTRLVSLSQHCVDNFFIFLFIFNKTFNTILYDIHASLIVKWQFPHLIHGRTNFGHAKSYCLLRFWNY